MEKGRCVIVGDRTAWVDRIVPLTPSRLGNTMLKLMVSRERLAKGAVFISRLVLGCVFISSSLPKLRLPYEFLSNVYNYELVGPKLGMLVAMVLPWLELLLGICLLGGIVLSGALLWSAILGAVFTFAQISALYRDLSITCGCFGSTHTAPITHGTVFRTCLLVVAAVIGYLLTLFLRSHQAPSVAPGDH